MTESQINKLKGKALSKAVAERLLGWKWYYNIHFPKGHFFLLPDSPLKDKERKRSWRIARGPLRKWVNDCLPPYAENLQASMVLVDHVVKKFNFTNFALSLANGWHAQFWHIGADMSFNMALGCRIEQNIRGANGDTPEEAICRATLMTLVELPKS